MVSFWRCSLTCLAFPSGGWWCAAPGRALGPGGRAWCPGGWGLWSWGLRWPGAAGPVTRRPARGAARPLELEAGRRPRLWPAVGRRAVIPLHGSSRGARDGSAMTKALAGPGNLPVLSVCPSTHQRHTTRPLPAHHYAHQHHTSYPPSARRSRARPPQGRPGRAGAAGRGPAQPGSSPAGSGGAGQTQKARCGRRPSRTGPQATAPRARCAPRLRARAGNVATAPWARAGLPRPLPAPTNGTPHAHYGPTTKHTITPPTAHHQLGAAERTNHGGRPDRAGAAGPHLRPPPAG